MWAEKLAGTKNVPQGLISGGGQNDLFEGATVFWEIFERRRFDPGDLVQVMLEWNQYCTDGMESVTKIAKKSKFLVNHA